MKNLFRTWTVDDWWYGVATQERDKRKVLISSNYLQLLLYYSRLGYLLPSRHHKYLAQLDQKQQVTNCSWVFANTTALDTFLDFLVCSAICPFESLGTTGSRGTIHRSRHTHTQGVQWESEATWNNKFAREKLESGSCSEAVVAVVACVDHFARRMRGQRRTCQSCKGRQGLDISTQKSRE